MTDELCYNQNDELYHHGIKGQKWGVQNGPPYPLGASDHSSSEKKAGWRKSLHKHDKSSDSKKKSKHRLKLEEKYRSKGMSAEEAEKAAAKRIRKEKIAVGAAALVAAYAGYKLADSGELNRLAQKGKAFIHGSPPQWRKKPELADPNMSAEDIFDRVVMGIFNNNDDIDHSGPINRDYGYRGTTGIGTKNNCRRCTFAYELRRRGYDVQATKSRSATGQHGGGLYSATHPGESMGKITAEYKSIKDIINDKSSSWGTGNPIYLRSSEKSQSIFETLSKHPTGSRGELNMYWLGGGGHSVAWEIVNGKPVIYDCQTGRKFASIDSFKTEALRIKEAYSTRLDNIELNNDFLLKWVQDSKGFRRHM